MYVAIENLKCKHCFKPEMHFENYLIPTVNTKNAKHLNKEKNLFTE